MSRLVCSGPASSRLALLLGWTGGKLQHLRKHEKLWHSLGWRTCATTVSINETFFPPAFTTLSSTASELLATCEAHRAEHRSPSGSSSLVVAHVFSNGGLLLMLSMLSQTAGAARPRLLDGAVYDSAPSKIIRPRHAPIVIASAGLPRADALLALAVHLPFALVNEAVSALRGGGPGTYLEPMGSHPDVRDPRRNPPRPELALYSDGDHLVRTDEVEDFVACRGPGMVGCRLGGTPHVGHFRAAPEAYAAAVRQLVERLEGGDGGGGASTVRSRL